MIAAPATLSAGSYITNGRRLGEVRRADEESVVIEEGPVSAAFIASVPTSEVGAEWRVVEFVPYEPPDYWLLKPQQKKRPRRKRSNAVATSG